MPLKSLQSKVFSFDRSSLWIEALVRGEDGVSEADAISFRFEDIRQIRGFGPQNSLITLAQGTEIVFNLTHEQLTRKFRECGDDVLDLKADTNLTPRNELSKKLKAEFAAAKEAAKYNYLEEMSITAFVRQSQDVDFRSVTFTGKELKLREMKDGGSIMGGQVTTLKLKAAGPFRNSDILLEGSLADFLKLTRQAYDAGTRDLDLSKYSMLKGNTPPPEKAAEIAARKRGMNP